MAQMYFTIKDLPKRGANEEPATKQQLDHLRSLAPFKDSDLADLGQWQAAYLIDQAVEIKNQIGSGPVKATGGWWKVLRVVLILLLSAATAKILFDWYSAREPQTNSQAQAASAKSPEAVNEADPFANIPTDGTKTPGHPRGPSGAKPTAPSSGTLSSLDGLALPIDVISTERFDLLNEVGKETAIPAGATIHIEKRGTKGSLTMHIKGTLYVGNELRLLRKVRLR